MSVSLPSTGASPQSWTNLRVDLDRDDGSLRAVMHEVPDVVSARGDMSLERLDQEPAEPVLPVLLQHSEARQLALLGHEADRADGLSGVVVVEDKERNMRARVVDPVVSSSAIL